MAPYCYNVYAEAEHPYVLRGMLGATCHCQDISTL